MDLALMISVVSLIVSILVAGIGFYYYSQANTIAQKSLELQNKLSDYSPNIIPIPDYISLKSDQDHASGDTSNPIVYSGDFNCELIIFTPYFGTARIDTETFVLDNEPLFKKGTFVEFNNAFNSDRKFHDQPVISGLNKLNFSVPLSISALPDFDNVEHGTYHIGQVTFKATLENTERIILKEVTFYGNVFLDI